MKTIISNGGYYYKENISGKRTRISKDKYYKLNKV